MTGGTPLFCDDVTNKILERLAEGESLRTICRDPTMPALRTIFNWLRQHEDFRAAYILARDVQAETLFDELLEIADDGRNDWLQRQDSEGNALGWRENGEAIRRSQLRVDARKWMLSKLAPKKYGERLNVDATNEVTVKQPQLDLSVLNRDERDQLRELLTRTMEAAEAKARA